jgi:A/G-specific adenine glycosylase
MARSTRKPPRNPPAGQSLAATADPLAAWFQGAARDLPWRRLRSGYHALVSELMLQQTQVARVLEKFEPFIRRFPTPAALAAAPEGEVLAAWQGLGYYRRARLLHAAAKAVVERHGGEVPADLPSLLALPGVGRYTAGAIASIVHGTRAPIVDGNVTRVFQRLASREGSASDRSVSDWAWQQAAGFVSTAADPAASNEALMELGATVCTPANPRCLACPVSHLCAAYRTGKADRIPAPKRRAVRKDLVFVCARLTLTDGAVLLEQRPSDGLWGGLWQPPTAECADGEAIGAVAAAELLQVDVAVVPAGAVPFATTHRAIRFVVFEAKVRGKGAALAAHGRQWVTPGELPGFALSNAAKRVLAL